MHPDPDIHPEPDDDSNPSIIWNRVFGANPATKANTTQQLDTILAAYNKMKPKRKIKVFMKLDKGFIVPDEVIAE